jgi:hypothetical protein
MASLRLSPIEFWSRASAVSRSFNNAATAAD